MGKLFLATLNKQDTFRKPRMIQAGTAPYTGGTGKEVELLLPMLTKSFQPSALNGRNERHRNGRRGLAARFSAGPPVRRRPHLPDVLVGRTLQIHRPEFQVPGFP